MQDRHSLSDNRTGTSISRSKQLETAIPGSKISALSSGEFVGMVIFSYSVVKSINKQNNIFPVFNIIFYIPGFMLQTTVLWHQEYFHCM